MKKIFLFLLLVISFLLAAEVGNNIFDLLKLHIENQQFDLAKTIIETTEFDSTMQDSVAQVKISFFSKTRQWEKAIDNCIYIFSYSANDSLQNATFPIFENLLNFLPPAGAIEKITTVIKQTNNTEIHQQSLFLLASVYERNHLFGEAKDVYYVLLNDTTQVDTLGIYRQIVRSDIYLQNFEAAIGLIDSLIPFADGLYLPDFLFLHFISNYSSGNLKLAKSTLLELYLHYPNHKNRNEIIQALADIYFDEKQYLLSWYFYDKLYEISSAFKRLEIMNTLQELKEALVEDSLFTGQFKFFQPIFEDLHEQEQ